MEWYGLDDLLDDASRTEVVDGALIRKQTRRNPFIFLLDKMGIEVRNTGSTFPQRLTYVFDPSDSLCPFPPDFDLHLLIRRGGFGSFFERAFLQNRFDVGFRRGFSRFGSEIHQETDEIHKLKLGHLPVGDFVFFYSLMSERSAIYSPFDYCDSVREISLDERREIRALKLWAIRSGIYSGGNNGLKGIDCEELVGRHGSAQESLFVLRDQFLSANPFSEGVTIAGNTLRNVSRHAQARALLSLDTFYSDGVVPARSYSADDWQDYAANRFDLSLVSGCSPGSCGRDVSAVFHAARDILVDLLKDYHVKKDIDIHVIPRHGREQEVYDSLVFVSLPDKNYSPHLLDDFREKMNDYEERHKHITPKIKGRDLCVLDRILKV